jgi:uncharacterized metal-binding protein YceD (DUF177 family)
MAEFDGKVSTREVERKVYDLSADQTDNWVKNLLKRCAPEQEVVGFDSEQWAAKSSLQLTARVEKVGSDYLVTGDFNGKVPAGCSRCGDPFMVERKSEFRVFLVPGKDPEIDVSDDPDYVFFYTDDIDLIDVFSEQLIVLESVAEHPPMKEDGSCLLCHRNPKFNEENIKDFVGNSAFSKLKDLKLKN